MQSWSFQKSTSTNDFIKKLPPLFEFLSQDNCRNAVLAIAHQTFQPSWVVEVLNAIILNSLRSSVGRASVYQTEGPEFNPRWGHKSFELFLNFYLFDNVFCRGQEPIQLHNGHNFQCNHEASKNPLPPMISSKSFRHNLNFCPKTTAAMRYLAIAHQTFPSQLRNSTSKCNILNSQR